MAKDQVEDHLLAPPEEQKLLDRPAEERLREQVETDKKKKDEAHKKPEDEKPKQPRRGTLWLIGLAIVIVLVLVFFLGFLPRHNREKQLELEARSERESIPIAYVTKVKRSSSATELLLPGNVTPLQEASIYARAGGYLRKRYVDIGDRVRQGQLMAEVEAPELDQQVAQAQAAVSQAEAQVRQSKANVEQSRSNLDLAVVTNKRYQVLVAHGVLSRQEGDQQAANQRSAQATTNAAQETQQAAEDNVRAAKANLERVIALQNFKFIRAPFNGVVTARTVDVGALISSNGGGQGNSVNSQPSGGASSTSSSPGASSQSGSGGSGQELFRVAQLDTLRILINVPQGNAPAIQIGQPADLILQEFPKRRFVGRITRTSASVDPGSRTMLTEVQIENRDRALLPGMYAQVQLHDTRPSPPLLIPGDAILTRAGGSLVAVLENPTPEQLQEERKEASQDTGDKKERPKREGAKRVHVQRVEIGRDYGTEVEITAGLQGNEFVVVNPGDNVKDGALIRPAAAAETPKAPGPGGPSDKRPAGITSPGEAAVSQTSQQNGKGGGGGGQSKGGGNGQPQGQGQKPQ